MITQLSSPSKAENELRLIEDVVLSSEIGRATLPARPQGGKARLDSSQWPQPPRPNLTPRKRYSFATTSLNHPCESTQRIFNLLKHSAGLYPGDKLTAFMELLPLGRSSSLLRREVTQDRLVKPQRTTFKQEDERNLQ